MGVFVSMIKRESCEVIMVLLVCMSEIIFLSILPRGRGHLCWKFLIDRMATVSCWRIMFHGAIMTSVIVDTDFNENDYFLFVWDLCSHI